MEQTQRGEDTIGSTAGESKEVTIYANTLEVEGWKDSISAQVESLRFIQDSEILTASKRTACVSAFAKKKAIPEDRVEAMLSLLARGNHLDVERALQALHSQPDLRLPDEEVYPKKGWLGKYLNYSQGNEVPMAFHFWTAITLLGAASKRNYYLDMGVYRVYPNQYILILGPSGLKKSTALYIGEDIITRMNDKLHNAGASDHQLIRIMPKKMGPEVFLKNMQSKPLNAAQTEWTDSLALILASELSVLIGKTVFHSDMFIEILTDLYDCPEKWQSGTISRGEEVFHNIAVSLLGASTPDWAMDSISDKMFKGGFFGRLVLCWRDISEKAFPVAQFLDPIVGEELAEDLALIAAATHSKNFILTEAASKWYEDWYYTNHDRMINEQEEEMRGYLSRKHNHIFATAMALALSEGTMSLTRQHLKMAEFYLAIEERESLSRIVATVGQHEEDKISVKIMHKIWAFKRDTHKNPTGIDMSKSDVSRRCMYLVGNTERLDKVLQSLIDRGWLELYYEDPAEGSSARRATVRYKVKGWTPSGDKD